jgi:hypothetical protein
MELNKYSKEKLGTLLLAVSIAKEKAIQLDGIFVFNQLSEWAEEINQAIKDIEFEESL